MHSYWVPARKPTPPIVKHPLKHLSCSTKHLSSMYQASVKQAPMKHLSSHHQLLSSKYQAAIKHLYLLDRCLMVAWYLLDRCLVVAWQMLHRCLLDRCLVHAWQMLYTAWQMHCAAWQMLEGMLDNQLSSIWHSAQSICQALDGNGGVVRVNINVWVYRHEWGHSIDVTTFIEYGKLDHF